MKKILILLFLFIIFLNISYADYITESHGQTLSSNQVYNSWSGMEINFSFPVGMCANITNITYKYTDGTKPTKCAVCIRNVAGYEDDFSKCEYVFNLAPDTFRCPVNVQVYDNQTYSIWEGNAMVGTWKQWYKPTATGLTENIYTTWIQGVQRFGGFPYYTQPEYNVIVSIDILNYSCECVSDLKNTTPIIINISECFLNITGNSFQIFNYSYITYDNKSCISNNTYYFSEILNCDYCEFEENKNKIICEGNNFQKVVQMIEILLLIFVIIFLFWLFYETKLKNNGFISFIIIILSMLGFFINNLNYEYKIFEYMFLLFGCLGLVNLISKFNKKKSHTE